MTISKIQTSKNLRCFKIGAFIPGLKSEPYRDKKPSKDLFYGSNNYYFN